MAMRGFITRLSPACLLSTRPFLSVYSNQRAASFQSRLGLPKFPLPSTSRQSFHSSPTQRNKWISSDAILYELKHRKIEKWGWVFYRTTYKDDEAWDIFKQKVDISVRSIINLDPRSEINEAMFDKLKFVFIEDKAKFDGASKEDLRAHFQEWVADSFSAENPRADQKLLYDDKEPVARYRFFFEIDEDALRSCSTESSGHANFIDGFSSSQARSGNPNLAAQKISEQPQNKVEAIEDCSDVDWMKMDMAFFMDTHFYAGMSMAVEHMWPFLYERPPTIVPNSKLMLLMQFQYAARRRLIPYNRHPYHKVPICAITMKNARLLAVALAAAFLSESTFALINNPMKPPNERFVLNAQQALIAVKAASAKAVTNNAPSTIVVADPYGFPIAVLRMDNAFIESVDTCIKKTSTVSLFNGALTSGDLQPLVQPGREDYGIEHTNGGMLPIPGAVPLFINGTFFAAIGACGGSGDQDIEAATAGVFAVGGTLEP
ncbi:unnamed protein product [Penicillium discolor]